MEEITIYKFQLEAIKEALRITANIHDSRNKRKDGETCHDRMVRQAEKYAENALEGKKDVEVRYIQYCVQLAYEEIKDRTGQMKNGTFVKDKQYISLQ